MCRPALLSRIGARPRGTGGPTYDSTERRRPASRGEASPAPDRNRHDNERRHSRHPAAAGRNGSRPRSQGPGADAVIVFRNVLCPIDFSETSARALAYASAFASWYGATLTVLHVVPDFE